MDDAETSFGSMLCMFWNAWPKMCLGSNKMCLGTTRHILYEWRAIREKKEAHNTFELLAIKMYCYFNIFHVRVCMKICTHPRKFHWDCLGFWATSMVNQGIGTQQKPVSWAITIHPSWCSGECCSPWRFILFYLCKASYDTGIFPGGSTPWSLFLNLGGSTRGSFLHSFGHLSLAFVVILK
jgi:hypothetical protein